VKKVLGLVVFSFLFTSSVALAQTSLLVVFPPTNYQTSTEKIFFIGTTPQDGQVFINGRPITRTQAGHFSPSLPLQLGEKVFKVSYQNQEREIKLTRLSTLPELPPGLSFTKDALTPAVDIARLPGEVICFGAIAPPQASVSVKLANQIIPLSPQPSQAQLPANSSVLTGKNQPTTSSPNKYQGCTTVAKVADLGQPLFSLTLNGNTATQLGPGKISILTPTQLPVTEVIAASGVVRTGLSTDYSRLDWQQVTPQQVKYTFNLKNLQQWGYKLKYDHTTLVLSLRHAPNIHTRKLLPLSGIKIVLDPGHGGKDPGAIGIGGIQEKDIILPISRKIAEVLQRNGVQVVLTRDSDYFVSLPGRVQMAERANADVFVSIHANSAGANRPEVSGLETYYYDNGLTLARIVHNRILQRVNVNDRRVRKARFYVLRKSSMPSILVETGYLTGREDISKLRTSAYQNQMAEAIAEGILQYLKQR
jgi:N-acetylmuramoyl-L-alanine amidase